MLKMGMFVEMDYGKDVKIDLVDKKILAIVGKNCRTSHLQIAKMAGIGKDTVRYRLDQLQKKQLYRGNILIVNPFRLPHMVLVSVLIKVNTLNVPEEAKVIEYFSTHPFVAWASLLQGPYDFNVFITALGTKHMDQILKDIKATLKTNIKKMKVLHISKMDVCKTIPSKFEKQLKLRPKKPRLDTSFAPLLTTPECSSEDGPVPLDSTDLKILLATVDTAHLHFQEISSLTGLSSDIIKYRITKLIEKNVIMSFRGSINLSYLKYHGHAAFIRISPGVTEKKRNEIRQYFMQSEHITYVFESVLSPFDFQVFIISQDPYDLNSIMNDIRTRFSDAIEDYEMNLILNDFKFTHIPEGIRELLSKK